MALNYAETQLQKKGEFVRYISHEILTPLNTILLGLEYLTKKLSTLVTTSDPIAVECATVIEDLNVSSKNAVEVLNEFLTYDKLETGMLVLDCTMFAVKFFVEDAVKPFRLQVINTSHTLYIYLPILILHSLHTPWIHTLPIYPYTHSLILIPIYNRL